MHEAAKRHAFAPEVPAQEVGIAVAGAVDEPGGGVDGVEHQDRAGAVIVRAANDGGLQLGGTEYVDRLGNHGRLVGRRVGLPIERKGQRVPLRAALPAFAPGALFPLARSGGGGFHEVGGAREADAGGHVA